MRKFLLGFCIILIFVVACTQKQAVPTTTTPQPAPKVQETKSIDPAQIISPKPVISDEVKQLFDKSSKVKSIYYKYKGPETADFFHEFYIKGDKIKYRPGRDLKSLDNPESYDVIYIDKALATAKSYCDAAYCTVKGKKTDLNYNNFYIRTPMDWMNGLEKADRIGEEVIDDRKTWKLDTERGQMWIDTFYGIPLKVISNGQTYRFQQISINGVTDADVTPSS